MSKSENATDCSISIRRLLVIASGSINAAMLPFWLNWMRATHPETKMRLIVTAGANRFVSREALTSICGSEVIRDEWPEDPRLTPLHVELADWPDAIAAFPASFHYTARLALGLGDTPSILALQCTSAPIAVGLSPPPGALRKAALGSHVSELESRPNVRVVLPQTPQELIEKGTEDPGLAPLPKLLSSLDEMCRAAGKKDQGEEHE